jgi:hypothetical protein
MEVVAYDPFLSPEVAKDLRIESVTLEELLKRADVVTLHVPMTEQTRNLINADRLAQMKKSARIVGDDAEAWRKAIDDIVQGDRYPELRANGFRPQFGLVPLGRDPGSGLQEFLDLATHDGPIPARDADGRLQLAADSGVVLVLIPGGSFRMGAQREDESAPNFDLLARDDDEGLAMDQESFRRSWHAMANSSAVLPKSPGPRS